ncbi:dTMP kinase [Streptomyces monticola]|uniref:Thymidylate kinase n=1 Tax=Streptomyces monticola TaxID=2666263 RepID=A0ABW2JQD2_9ACTN
MTRAEQPTVVNHDPDDALVADSRERAVRALLRFPPLKRLWSAQLVGSIGDALALLVLVVLSLQAAVIEGSFGGGYRGAAFAVAAVFGVRILATLLFGAVLLGPLTSLTSAQGPLDRRWTMIGADGLRAVLLIVAPLWIDWTPDSALAVLLVTGFVVGVAERFWTVSRESAAPALLPAPPLEGATVRPLPDHMDALRRLSLRTAFVALPLAAFSLIAVTLVSNLLGAGIEWFDLHQAALASYVAAGLFAASLSVVYFLELPDTQTPRARSPLEGLRRPKTGTGVDKGRTGASPLLVLACAAVAGAIAAAVAVAVLHAVDLSGGPVLFGLLVVGLTGGTVLGIRTAASVLPALSRRRLLALAIALTGLGLLAAGLVPDPTTVLLIVTLSGYAAGVAANTGHALLDQEVEDFRRARTTEHLQAVVRVFIALGALAAPLLAAAIGPHRVESGKFVFAHGGAAFALMLAGALLLPVAALVLARTDDRSGVPLRRDLSEALRGGGDPVQAPAATGFFIALEGGDGAGKSTQADALAEWIRAKGHEVVLTREPGATPVGKRLRSILLDVSSAGLSHRAEALLYAADRAEHVDTVVRPALERGAVVITDRYIDSSVAYQGAGRDLSPTEIARISRWATDGLVPHLTVLLDVSPETARERFTEAPDRLESEPAEFHARVRSGFLTLAASDPGRYLVVDAGQEPEAVTTVVRHRLDQVLPLSEAELKAQEEARKAAEEEARRKAEEEAARKAEEERQERERQEQLARLRAEEEERKRRELEEARRREAERQAEEARQRAEEARRLAEEERKRREAEEKVRAAEEERRRRQAEEESRLRAEAEARRLEKQRKAEESLLRAEQARRAATTGASAAAAASTASAASAAAGKEAAAAPGKEAAAAETDSETTVPTPIVKPDAAPSSAADETTVLPVANPERAGADNEETAVLPQPPAPQGAADETAVLPPVRDARPAGNAASNPADRVPPGIFREERQQPSPDEDRTRELPQVDPESGTARRRPRSDWAEETPLDDLPSLADELLGERDEDEGGRGGRGGRGRRG